MRRQRIVKRYISGAGVSVQDNVSFKAFALVFAALVFFTVSIVFLANTISTPSKSYTDPLVQAQLADRLRPIGRSRVVE